MSSTITSCDAEGPSSSGSDVANEHRKGHRLVELFHNFFMKKKPNIYYFKYFFKGDLLICNRVYIYAGHLKRGEQVIYEN